MSRLPYLRRALLGGLALAALAGAEEPPPTPDTASATGAPPFGEFREMLERPLFSSTRRPPVLLGEAQENLDARQLREAWRLTGIVLQDGRQLATFSQRQGDQRLRLEVGMVLVDDWRLERIERDQVLLGNDIGQVEMILREPTAAETPPALPAAADQPERSAPATGGEQPPPAEKPAPAEPAKQG
ncbi:hypothetical protein [Pseudomonas indica]|uniref:General secretion pathway protein N n=1 Tax=Pseudomonas indica TaxID=137658 RepID=A0A1G8U1I9_9PSED|nr:hypothetical protein [Pseudomonas indica]SDJ47621.1 hypothetical protein SAMN05216186_101539 [Pseudomonas indica]